jgi:hypothetical protein
MNALVLIPQRGNYDRCGISTAGIVKKMTRVAFLDARVRVGRRHVVLLHHDIPCLQMQNLDMHSVPPIVTDIPAADDGSI